jgi:hypothetical protein
VGESGRTLGDAVRTDLAEELSRRQFLGRASALGLGAVVLGALGAAQQVARAAPSLQLPVLEDATLQAFFDTIIPGKPVPDLRTQLGNRIHRHSIAGVDSEHGAVYTDALLLAHNPRIGFDLLAPALLAEIEALAVVHGGTFVSLDYERRERVCKQGLAFSNPTRVIWEAGAAVPFTAFCAAANVRNATAKTAAGYAVMGHPGTARHGYGDFSYGRSLSRERPRKGYLP